MLTSNSRAMAVHEPWQFTNHDHAWICSDLVHDGLREHAAKQSFSCRKRIKPKPHEALPSLVVTTCGQPYAGSAGLSLGARLTGCLLQVIQ